MLSCAAARRQNMNALQCINEINAIINENLCLRPFEEKNWTFNNKQPPYESHANLTDSISSGRGSLLRTAHASPRRIRTA
jgi:hypothetical protein